MIKIEIKKEENVYYFTSNGKKLCHVGADYLSNKGIDMIDKATEADLSSADWFNKLADEQGGIFRHINNVVEYINQKGETLYSIIYDRDNGRDQLDLTLEQLKKAVEAGLPEPTKDIKIVCQPGIILGFSRSPKWGDVEMKLA